MRRLVILGVTVGMLSAACAFVPGVASADTTIGFDDLAPGTTVTTQYADAGGAGQGVRFGPLPGDAGAGLNPVVRSASGQAHSGSQVADISTCSGCEFYVPQTTGTFAVPRSHVSVDVGLLGAMQVSTPAKCLGPKPPTGCAYVTLEAFDASGAQVATTSPTLVAQGFGVQTSLSVSTPTAEIVGFKVTGRSDGSDDNKAIAIDDLSFDTPPPPTTPDFTLNPTTTHLTLTQGGSVTDGVTIGRIGGSTGDVTFAASSLPSGVRFNVLPNPATDSTTITLGADVDAAITPGATITVTGTPVSASAGGVPRSFTLIVAVQPAFTLGVVGQTTVSLAPCRVTIPLQLSRNSPFTGPVGLSLSGLQPGVSASFDNTVTFPGGETTQTVGLTLATSIIGQSALPHVVTIIATAPPYTARMATVTVAGSCQPQYSPEIVSMQVTQGTQLPELPQRNASNPGAAIPYASIASLAKPGTLQALAELAAGKTTYVRVFGQLASGGPLSEITVPGVLHGYRKEGRRLVELKGSPILPVTSSDALVTDLTSRIPDLQDFSAINGIYDFALPPSWTQGAPITLTANLLPQPVSALPGGVQARAAAGTTGTPTPINPCTSTACRTLESFSISQVPFRHVASATIRPVAMIVKQPYDATLPDPDSTFSWARVVTPRPLIIEPYAETIDISDVLATPDDNGSQTLDLLKDIRNYVCANGSPSHGWVIGVEHAGIRTAQSQSWCADYLPPGWHDISFAVVNAPAPIQSVAHELFHLFGRLHASACNGANVTLGGGTGPVEDWPKDERGELQSVGLAPSAPGALAPFRAFSSQVGQSYDFMSYCATFNDNPTSSMTNAWVSVHNWNALMNASAPALDRTRAPAARPAAARPVSALDVSATVTPGGKVTIDDVTPTRVGLPTDGPSAYHLAATDAGGRVRTNVPMLVSSSHIDGPRPIPFLTLRGVVPAANVSAVAIRSSGATMAVRRRGAHPPRVQLLGTPRLRRGVAAISWRASGSGPAPLDVVVQYSANGGRNWTPIWIGPNLGRALVPARYLSRAADARIRIDAHDGFQTTTASSPRFSARGAPPTVRIESPVGGRHEQPNDAPLLLGGSAFDDRDRMLTGASLHWMLGRRLLGTGDQISVVGLPAGADRIRLVARDRFRRTGSASVIVRLQASRPMFLALSVPTKISRTARGVRLDVTSSLPARLSIRGNGVSPQQIRLGLSRTSILVRIKPGTAALRLSLALSAGGLSAGTSVAIART